MVNNSTNINRTNNHLSLLNSLNTKRGTATYDIENPVFGFIATGKFRWKSHVVKVDFTLSVVQSEVQGHLVILISLLLYICHVSFQKMLISCLLKYIVLIKYFESDFLEKFSLLV